jgi:hypothetical protein
VEQPEMVQEMFRRMAAAQEDACIHVGWVHDIVAHSEYDMPGVAVRISWLDEEAQVTAIILWVPMPGVLELLRLSNKLHSEEFKRDMEKIGG